PTSNSSKLSFEKTLSASLICILKNELSNNQRGIHNNIKIITSYVLKFASAQFTQSYRKYSIFR
ncbi:hypothetical protein, partial [Enterobacter cloacae complex sp. 2DZ2F20B]|uniref:hypothetical protein n=1 Tax=Enterobacter cloacae complex sp. 2DZ2F20B TaxID=2511993 RepID=UPI001CA52AA4